MTIYNKALDTYKAIHGPHTNPTYIPYQGASHTPFQGMDVDLVKSLVNETEVNKFLREWRKENKKTQGDFSHEHKDQIQYVTWRRVNKLVLLPFEVSENISRDSPLIYTMYDIQKFRNTYTSSLNQRFFTLSEAMNDFSDYKYRLPDPGEADKVQDLLCFKSPQIEHKIRHSKLHDSLAIHSEGHILKIKEIIKYFPDRRSVRVLHHVGENMVNTRDVLIGQIYDL